MLILIIIFAIILIAYWIFTFWNLIFGIYKLVTAKTEEDKNFGKSKLIIGVVLLIIGGGVCGTILNG